LFSAKDIDITIDKGENDNHKPKKPGPAKKNKQAKNPVFDG
jgi:hypothetical protein